MLDVSLGLSVDKFESVLDEHSPSLVHAHQLAQVHASIGDSDPHYLVDDLVYHSQCPGICHIIDSAFLRMALGRL